MTTKYILEIFEPGGAEMVAVSYESGSPFQAIQRGDLIDATAQGGQKVQQVVQVEHIFWDAGEGPRHKLCVFTKNIENTYEARLKEPS